MEDEVSELLSNPNFPEAEKKRILAELNSLDAYLVDVRMEPLLILTNSLFHIERIFLPEEDQSPEARLAFRKVWSVPIVNRIMEMLRTMRAAGGEYGEMVHRAIDYMLDDEEAFRTFLSDGRIDMHNIAIERCFRHIAMAILAAVRKSFCSPEHSLYVRVA